jgi:hypothetical protein
MRCVVTRVDTPRYIDLQRRSCSGEFVPQHAIFHEATCANIDFQPPSRKLFLIAIDKFTTSSSPHLLARKGYFKY